MGANANPNYYFFPFYPLKKRRAESGETQMKETNDAKNSERKFIDEDEYLSGWILTESGPGCGSGFGVDTCWQLGATRNPIKSFFPFSFYL